MQLDSCLPKEYLKDAESSGLEMATELRALQVMEAKLATTTQRLTRRFHALYCEPEVVPKILRLFIRHSFAAESSSAAPQYILYFYLFILLILLLSSLLSLLSLGISRVPCSRKSSILRRHSEIFSPTLRSASSH